MYKNQLKSVPPIAIILRIVLPPILAIGLFAGTIFFITIPAIEDDMMDGRKEMIRDLSGAAWTLLDDYNRRVRAGELSPAEARRRAVERMRALRYGPENKDYFWINDVRPYMIMHPYRPDLEGKDISGFADPRGKRLFMEMVEVVKQKNAGYVEYMWQWKDDPNQVAPKLSHVRLYGPRGWIVGTGVYIQDVHERIHAITRGLQKALLVILALVTALLGYITVESIRRESRRTEAERALLESEESLRAGLREKEILLKEIHHRVKNNMQVISSLLSLQASSIDDEAVRAYMTESINRVQAMAQVHEQLYQSGDFSMIDMADYIKTLAGGLSLAQNRDPGRISLVVDARPIKIDIEKAIPVGLMLNELITNAFKHAFPDGAGGVITVAARKAENGSVELTVADNGSGMPPGFDPARAGTLGLSLVNILTKQIDGSIEVTHNGGTAFRIGFKA